MVNYSNNIGDIYNHIQLLKMVLKRSVYMGKRCGNSLFLTLYTHRTQNSRKKHTTKNNPQQRTVSYK